MIRTEIDAMDRSVKVCWSYVSNIRACTSARLYAFCAARFFCTCEFMIILLRVSRSNWEKKFNFGVLLFIHFDVYIGVLVWLLSDDVMGIFSFILLYLVQGYVGNNNEKKKKKICEIHLSLICWICLYSIILSIVVPLYLVI